MNESNNPRKTRVIKNLFLFITLIILVITVLFSPRELPFWHSSTPEIISLLVYLLLIATFIERTVEVIIVVWRDKDRKVIENKIDQLKQKSELQARGIPRSISPEEESANTELDIYKSETKSLAMPLTFILGIIISALGIKVLHPLVDHAIFNTFSPLQRTLFLGVDTLITGALLGGGSKGIHEIIEAFLNTVEKYRENIKAK